MGKEVKSICLKVHLKNYFYEKLQSNSVLGVNKKVAIAEPMVPISKECLSEIWENSTEF